MDQPRATDGRETAAGIGTKGTGRKASGRTSEGATGSTSSGASQEIERQLMDGRPGQGMVAPMKTRREIDPDMIRENPDEIEPGSGRAGWRPFWEYKSLKLPHLSDAALSKLGGDGWELVSTSSCREDPSQTVFHFKRRKVS